MKGLLALIAVVGAIVIGVGLYRGWFTINEDRIRQDPAVQTAKEKLHEIKEDARRELDKTKSPEPANH